MKVPTTIGAAITACALVACATPQDSTTPAADTGTVRGIYVEVAPDLYLERTLVGDSSGTEWAQVTLAGSSATAVNARIARGQPLAIGDTVRLQMAGPRIYEAELLPEASKVVAVLSHPITPATPATPVDDAFLGALARD